MLCFNLKIDTMILRTVFLPLDRDAHTMLVSTSRFSVWNWTTSRQCHDQHEFILLSFIFKSHDFMWCNARRQQRQPKHSFAWLEFLLSLSAKFRYNLDVCARTCANDNVSNWCFFFGNFVVAHVSMSALTSDQISCTQIKSIGFFLHRSKHIALSNCSNIEFSCTPLYLSLSRLIAKSIRLNFVWKTQSLKRCNRFVWIKVRVCDQDVVRLNNKTFSVVNFTTE